ncbi:Translocation protein S66 [Friedmanniomyces endolithicus]|uniref:Translocation protein S66 n=1 Tax=Friedmanniomyces endolithicus TaxID=329885 RepID=A0AAN6FNS0_9PEZI|nr:Translocation protein S66 [Friedmanniomyces endolithicus]KAK0285350.1 Translocation protein S66 [Friedmanniomyces endolithicus]KAK0321011.1 Translocation protein S66 [Friedmanniomyces endolithicus]KAK0919255.1 Translocation protein S66 [Friedmanniomyces endolithicus]KAK0972781.1 Translocation protein S66 [Friedmanniomyces endolithicus]
MENGTNSSSNSFNSSSNGTFEGVPPLQPTKSFWTNLLLPALYLIIVAASLYTFSSTYRKRQLAKTAKLEPWFPPHRQRDVYLSLLHLDPSEQAGSGDGDSEKKLSRVPDSVLKAALLQRALEDIKRIVQLRQAKPAFQTLLQRGSVGDELWQRLLRAEQEMEAEVKDVVNEANAFAPEWGQVIFQSANEMNQNLLIKQRMAELQDTLEAEKAWWDKKRAGIQSDFMKELEEADGKPAEEAKAAAAPPAINKKNGSSDDDAVIVEAGGPAQAQGGSGKGKKKGKK